MATLALSLAGQFAGGLVGGPFGATVGRALGALAGSAIDNALFAPEETATLPSPFALQGSSEGGVIPRIYGWNRVTGNIIWATNLERQTVQNAGSKGLSTSEEEQIFANFAVGLCQGDVARIGRIWADGRLLETQGINFRFYPGSLTQNKDPLISIKQGEDNTPAYRGLCYLVFEGLPLGEYGNRIPNISVEIYRIVGDLEPAIKAITLIPGATEFGYDPVPRVRIVSPGKTVGENTNLLGQSSDWTLSIDELQSLCPNLKHVALVVAWFGDDLRCGQCKIQPRVENVSKTVFGTSWVVSGNGRSQVPVMSQYQGGPAYGGTPSDTSVLAAIADLKSRGIKVTLYPFVLMDIAQGNGLSDPYSGAANQSAYPWRGRITCNPAPGEVGSPDKSAAIISQIDAFVGAAAIADFSAGTETINYTGSIDWGYRRMILHYAKLAAMAGGIDAMLIGSELRGLTWLRSNNSTSFPFVDALVTLADDVRSILGAGTKLSYGADWSEYSGLQPIDEPGDKIFHLDSLWASPSIDAIGIDNYMPLSDWRGNGDEPDALIADNPYQLEYLQANISGGEGFDWYYGSEADRLSGTRSLITDGVAAEPWVWRFKDIKSWWSNAHHNRVGGVRSATSTPWIPQSKPIWFTELGCGAVDKGPNQPNVFGDAKSVESARPYFSNGKPDPLAQRQFLRAHHHWWQAGSADYDPVNNPNSSLYSGQMLDPERIYVWTWDARPFPAFPNRQDVWSDGANHKTGHWLTGRLGVIGGEEFLTIVAKDYGVSFDQIGANNLQIHGAQLSSIVSLRGAIEPYLDATAMFVRDGIRGLSVLDISQAEETVLTRTQFAAGTDPILVHQDPNSDESIGQLALTYIDRVSDYQAATVTAIVDLNPVKSGIATNLVLDGQSARASVENILAKKQASKSIEFGLPFSKMSLEVGDLIQISDSGSDNYMISSIREGHVIKVTAHAQTENSIVSFDSDQKFPPLRIPQVSALPSIFAAHVPGAGGDIDGTKTIMGAFAEPWPGNVSIVNDNNTDIIVRLIHSAAIGVLAMPLQPASSALWDRANEVVLDIYSGHLSSVSELDALNGLNQLAVLKNDGQCEIIGFADAVLIAEGRYRLSMLLRGQNNSIAAANILADTGNSVILVNSAVQSSIVTNAQLETELAATAFAGASDLVGQSVGVSLLQNLAKPFAPSHPVARKVDPGGDIKISWKRRTQVGGDSWVGTDVPLDFSPERYVVSILDGSTLVRQLNSNGQSLIYSSANQVSDFGAALLPFNFNIQQISAVHGVGADASGSFTG